MPTPANYVESAAMSGSFATKKLIINK